MKRYLIGVLALCLVASGYGPAQAQQFGENLGDLYLSFSPTEQIPTQDVPAFQPFNFYLVVEVTYADIGHPEYDVTNGPSAWESYVSIPDEIVITSKVLQPASSINVGPPPPDSNDSNWIVGTGLTITAVSTPYAVVHYSGLILVQNLQDLALELGPADPSSFDDPGGPGPIPGWVDGVVTGECTNKCLRGFANWQDRMVVNCVNAAECNPVPTTMEIALGSREGAPGSFVEVPVTVSLPENVAAGDPSILAGLDLELAWDPAVGTLTDVTLAGATADWLMEFNPGMGNVDISMAGLNTIDVPPTGVDVLYLQFQLGPNAGTSAVSFTSSQAFDLDQLPIDHVTVDGSLTVGAAPELIELALDDVAGAGGSTVDVPFTVTRLLAPLSGDPSQLAGIDLSAQWDSSVANLVDVLLTPATTDWLMQFNASTGFVDISMASLSTIDVPPSGVEMLTLRFELASAAATTPLEIVDSRAFDVDQQAVDHTTRDGSLTVECEKGDVVPDGEVNSADAIRTLFFAMDLLTPTPVEFCAADMNSDGLIDVGDVVLILQRAVGLLIVEATPGTPFLYTRSGEIPGEMIVHVENAAGIELALSYDPDLVTYVSASAPGSGGLTLANHGNPGKLEVGFAKATAFEGEIRLKFEIEDPQATIHIDRADAFDELAVKRPFDVLSDEFIFGVTGIDDRPQSGRTAWLGATPNPFNPATNLRFVMAESGDATLTIFDVAGRRVREIVGKGLSAGEHSVLWDGRDDASQGVASGAYLVRLQTKNATDTGRVMMLK